MNLFNRFSKKPKFYFDFTETKNINIEDISDPYALVRHIENENKRLIRDQEKASVVVTKVRNDEFAQELYAQRFELPLDPKTKWMEVMKPFFTKKKLDFVIEQAEFSVKSPLNSKDKSDWLDFKTESSKDSIDSSTTGNTMDSITPDTTNASSSTGERKQIQKVSEQADFEKATNRDSGWHDYETDTTNNTNDGIDSNTTPDTIDGIPPNATSETDEMKSESALVPSKSQKDEEAVNPFVKEDNSSLMSELIQKQRQVEPAKSQGFTENLTTFKAETVRDFLELFSSNARQTFTNFMEQENKKIYEEVLKQDKRADIPEMVKTKYQSAKNQALEKATLDSIQKRDLSIEQENLRHEQALREIKLHQIQAEKENHYKIEVEYSEMIQSEIKHRYDGETRHLNNILEGKKSALSLRRTELSKGINSSLEQVLADVNNSEEELLKSLNQLQKPTARIIDFKGYQDVM